MVAKAKAKAKPAKPKAKPKPKPEPAKAKQEKPIGEVSNYFEHVGVASIKLSKTLKVGDKIHIKGGEDTDFEQTVDSMQVHRDKVEKAKPGDDVGIKVDQKVRKGYKLFKV